MSGTVAPAASGQPPAPRWGVQASLIKVRQPAFWLFLALLGIGGYLFVSEQELFSHLPTALTLSWGLVLLYAVPVFVLIYRVDLFEREPKLVLAAALIWGGVIAVSLAGYANDAWLSVLGKLAPADFTADWGAAVVAPITEETLKLTGVILLFLIAPAEFDGVMDGFVYGAMVGLGFTVVEDVSYFIHATVVFGGADQIGPVIDTFLIRIVAGGLYSHVLFAGLTGIGFAYFVTSKAGRPKRLFVFAALLLAGAGAHFVWDSPWMMSVLNLAPGTSEPSTLQWIQYGAVKGLPFLILLVVMVLFATRSEERGFRAIMAGETDQQVITDREIGSLRSLWSRRGARAEAKRIRGPQGARLTGRIQAAQIEYAMIRSRTTSPTDPALEAQREKIRTLRTQLATMQYVPAAGVAAGPVVVPGTPAPVAAMWADGQASGVVASVAAVAPVVEAGATTLADIAPARSPTVEPVAVPAIPDLSPEVGAPAPEPAMQAGPESEPEVAVSAPEPAIQLEPEPVATTEPVATPEPDQPAAEPLTEPAPTQQPEPESTAVSLDAATIVAATPIAATAEPVAVPVQFARPQPPAWAPTHFVPPGGMAAWAAPDPSRPPMVYLPERLELVVESAAGAWAFVRAVNGWRGWVDGRRLIERG